MYNLIIAGSREFTHPNFYRVLELAVETFEANARKLDGPVTVFWGCAKGMDTHGKAYADARGWLNRPFPADWAQHKKMAGPIRNQEMIDAGAHGLVVVCLDDSRGSADMHRRATKADLDVLRFQFKRHWEGKVFNENEGRWVAPK